MIVIYLKQAFEAQFMTKSWVKKSVVYNKIVCLVRNPVFQPSNKFWKIGLLESPTGHMT